MDDWHRYVVKSFPINSLLTLCPTACKRIFATLCDEFHELILIINKAEHHVIYQYRLVNAADHYMGLIQTESVSQHIFIRYNMF